MKSTEQIERYGTTVSAISSGMLGGWSWNFQAVLE